MRLAINNNEKNYLAISFFFLDHVCRVVLDSRGRVITRPDGVEQGFLCLRIGRSAICHSSKGDAITLLI